MEHGMGRGAINVTWDKILSVTCMGTIDFSTQTAKYMMISISEF